MDKFTVTLDNCANEPIHIPGSIQPHGALVVLNKQHNIEFVSNNMSEYLKLDADCMGKKLSAVFGADFSAKISQGDRNNNFHQKNPYTLEILDNIFHVIASNCEDKIILDIETYAGNEAQAGGFYYKIRDFVAQLAEANSFDQIFNEAVEEVRKLTSFDRVMLYRFDEEYNGQVVAEAKKESLNTFLHQHFPESDIPVQARRLYVKNPIRLIADVDAEPIPIIPQDKEVDLSTSALRSVSPIHIQYLKNMGVKASMSISLVVDDKLWGLIACHHYSPHIVPFQTREASVFLGQMVSYQITMRETTNYELTESELRLLNARLVERMANELDFEVALKNEKETLMKLVGAEGVAWNLTGTIERFGNAPSKRKVEELFAWLRKEIKGSSEFHTSRLPAVNPDFKAIASIASGILVLPLSIKDNFMLVWFRPEVIETKNWGGKPEKIIEFLDDGSHRLMPRSSFNIWKQQVKERSTPWQEVEVNIALKFRNSLMNYVLSMSERLKEINERLEKKVKVRTKELTTEIKTRRKAEEELKSALKTVKQSNAELEQFAYVASHDLQEPLRKIQAFGERLQNAFENLDNRNADYLSRMLSAAKRMQTLIQNLLSYSRVTTNAAPFQMTDLNEVLNTVVNDLQLMIDERDASIEIGEMEEILADPNQMHRLFQNLIQNAIKFSKPDSQPEIVISSERFDNKNVIKVKDNGIGFSPEYSNKIFELFERLHGRQSYDGTGLGLAICKKIVERHDGTIKAESEPDKGTTIIITLPLTAESKNSVS